MAFRASSILSRSRPFMATSASSRLKYLLILDFEANCGDGIAANKGNQEIIEWPTLLYNIETDALEDTFHEYVKPVVVPQLTTFCTELTGIEQVRSSARAVYVPQLIGLTFCHLRCSLLLTRRTRSRQCPSAFKSSSRSIALVDPPLSHMRSLPVVIGT